MKLTIFAKFIFIASLLGAFACGETDESDDAAAEDSTDDETSGSLAIENLADLPDATGRIEAVDENTAEDVQETVASFDNLEIDTALQLASTGVSLGDSANDIDTAFDAVENASKAMCDTTNQAMKYLFEMGSGDFLNCVAKAVLSDNEDIYDGESHIVDMIVELGEETASYRLHVKATRNGSDQLTGYEMAACSSEDSGSSYEQEQYLKIDITETTYDYYSKMKGPDGGFSWVDVSSSLNSDGELTGIKEVVYNDHNTNGSTYAEIKQSSENILYNGGQGDTRYYSFFELLDTNGDNPDEYAITKLAIGDGAALVDQNGSQTVQGWNGDTLKVDANSSRLTKVEDKSDRLVEVEEVTDPGFSSNEEIDCTKAGTIDVGTVDESTLTSCFERFEIDQEGSSLCNDLSY